MKKNLLVLTVLLLLQTGFAKTPLWKEVPQNFFRGIVEANFQPISLDEMFVIDKVHLPRPPKVRTANHPRLLFDSDQYFVLQRQNFKPYSKWANSIIQNADNNLNDPSSPFLSELKRSNIAKFSSFSYYLSNNDNYLVRAKTALLSISHTLPPATPEGGNWNIGWGDWMQAAEALRNYAVAYDLIYNDLSIAQRTQIEQSLTEQVEQIVEHYSQIPQSFSKIDLAMGLGIPKNNHIIDIPLGVLAVAMVIDCDRCDYWIEKSLDELGLGLSMISPDGSYREGGVYAQFVASRLFQFALYYENVYGINLHEIPRIKKFTKWMIEVERSDGSMPMWDDTDASRYFYVPLAIGLSDYSEEIKSNFERNYPIYFPNDNRIIEAFCTFDDMVETDNLPPQTKFYPDGGNLIFQNDNLQAMLLAEPLSAYTNHDHTDHLSLTFSAYNKHFMIDSGYGPNGVSDKNRDWFLAPEANNIPLVNGFGPNQNQVYGDLLSSELKSSFISKQISTSTVTTNYRETDISRTVIFPENNYLIVLDKFSSDELQRFSVPWQGLGEYQQLSSNSVSWQQDNVQLIAEFLSLDDGIVRPRLGLNSYSKKNNFHHSAEFALDSQTETEVITLLLPLDQIFKPKIREINPICSGEIVGRKIVTNSSEDIIILASSEWRYQKYSSDAEVCFLQGFDKPQIILHNATWLEIAGKKVFTSDQKIDLVLQIDNHWWGAIEAPALTRINFYTETDPKAVFIDDQIVDYQYDGKVIIDNITNGEFTLGRTQESLAIENFRSYYPMLFKLQNNSFITSDKLPAWQQNQLRQEILEYSREQIIGSLDGKTTEIIGNIYTIASGMALNIWDAEESFNLVFLQKFEIQREIFGYNVSYHEEGKVDFEGIAPVSQTISIDDKLYLSKDNPFSEYQLLRLDYYHQSGNIRSQWQEYQNLDSYQIYLSQMYNKQNYRFGVNGDNRENFSQSLGFYNRNVWLDFYLDQPDSEQNWIRANNGFQHKFYAMNSSINYSDQIESVSFSQNFNFNRIDFETGLELTDSITPKYLAKLFYGSDLNSTNISFSAQDSTNYYLVNRTKYKDYFLNFNLTNYNDKQSSISMGRQGEELGYSVEYREDLSLNSKLNFDLKCNYSLVIESEYDFDQKISRELRCGTSIYLRDYYWVNLGYDRLANDYLPVAEFVARIQLNKDNSINLLFKSRWLKNEVNDLKLKIENHRDNWSPGILLTMVDGELEKAEGYISWWF